MEDFEWTNGGNCGVCPANDDFLWDLEAESVDEEYCSRSGKLTVSWD